MSTLTVAKQHISSAALEPPYWNDIERRPVPSITEVPMPSAANAAALLIYMLRCIWPVFRDRGNARKGRVCGAAVAHSSRDHAFAAQGIQLFMEQQGTPPAVVSIASNFWDLASL